MKQITIPLQRFVDALLGSRPYCVINDDDAFMLVRAEGEGMEQQRQCVLRLKDSNFFKSDAFYVIENRADMLGMDGQPLPQLRDGLYRLWTPRDFELCDNKRRECVARMNEMEAKRKMKRNAVERSLVAKGVTAQAANMVVSGMTEAVVEMMWATLSEDERR